ncbi:hypothetical protein PG279_06805 [Riemerella anatipestifer]|nr:hypothetical protein [Riemerella anatipestifer]
MICKRKEIKNCSYLRVVNGAIFCDINGVCYMNWEKTQIPEDTIIFCYQKRTYFYLENELYEILLNGRLKKIIDFCPSSYIEPIENYYLVFNRISRKEKSYKLIDCNKNTIWLDKINWGYKVVKNLLFLFENDNKLSFINVKAGSPLWSYTLPEGFKIFGQIQVIENMLFFTAVDKGFNNSKLIALDIVSGNEKWEIDDAIFYQIDIEKKLLLGYSIKRYEVVEPFLGKKIVQKNMMEYYDKGLSPVSTNNTIANGKLWFVSGRGKNVKFGYINIETSEIGLIQDFPLENDAQLDKPVYHNGQLYLLDSNNNLHIFEE